MPTRMVHGANTSTSHLKWTLFYFFFCPSSTTHSHIHRIFIVRTTATSGSKHMVLLEYKYSCRYPAESDPQSCTVRSIPHAVRP